MMPIEVSVKIWNTDNPKTFKKNLNNFKTEFKLDEISCVCDESEACGHGRKSFNLPKNAFDFIQKVRDYYYGQSSDRIEGIRIIIDGYDFQLEVL